MGCNSSTVKNSPRKNMRVKGDSDLSLDANENTGDPQTVGKEASSPDHASRNRRDRRHIDLDKKLELKGFGLEDTEYREIDYTTKPSLSVPNTLWYQIEDTEGDQSEELIIVNKEEVPVFFKIKVTHPQVVLVKPNMGRIAAKSPVKVRVTLRSPPADDAGLKQLQRTKLMVQGLNVRYTESDVLPQPVWMDAPSASLSVNVVYIRFEEPATEDLDLSKFQSVNTADHGRRWWDHD